MYSSDMGYVPRKVGLHGDLLELRRGSLREPVELLLGLAIGSDTQ